jgi:hypothetical protein
MSLQNIFTLDVDFKIRNLINEPLVTQNDEVKFILNVYDDGMEFDLSNVSTFTLVSVRPDNVSVMTLGDLTETNQVTFALGSTEILVPGTVGAVIQLYDADGRVSTLPFTYKVLKDPVKDYVPSTDEQTLIELVLGQGPVILEEAKRVATESAEAEAVRVTAESKRITSETERVDAETSRVTAEGDRVSNESTRVESESARQTAETARIQAEKERQTNTSTAIQNAEKATTEATEATESINLALPNVLNLEYIAPYNAETQYLKNNIVRKDKNSYIALQPTLGNEPTGATDSPFWGVIAIGGVDGTGNGTVTSVNGVSPDENGNVTLVVASSWKDLNDKPSSFPPSAHTHVEADITDLGPNEPIEVQITRGSQVIAVPKGTPVNVLNFTGKTIINYAPLFDSGLWVKDSANVVTDAPNKITLTTTLAFGSYRVDIPMKESIQFTLSAKIGGLKSYLAIDYFDSSGAKIQGIDSIGIDEIGQVSYTSTTPIGTTTVRVLLLGQTVDTFTFENIMLNEGSTPQEFVANVKGVTNPTIENTTTSDAITYVGTFHEGDVVNGDTVTRAKREVVLDGSLSYLYIADKTGFKQIGVNGIKSSASTTYDTSLKTVKYNGKILENATLTELDFRSDVCYLYGQDFRVSIADTDSGWGETYTPTVAEIQAYFDGWYMYDNTKSAVNDTPIQYNGTGQKAWVRIKYKNKFSSASTSDRTFDFALVVPYAGYTPYRLIHDLVTPITESVETIGSLRLAEGDNTVELMEGWIVRERAFPKQHSNTNWYINYYGVNTSTVNKLDNKVDTFLGLYKNGKLDETGVFETSTSAYGNFQISISNQNFDPTAIYEVAYIPLEPYKVSAQANPITIDYRDTLGGVTEELVEDVTKLDSRLNSQQNVIANTQVIISETKNDLTKNIAATKEELIALIGEASESGGGGGAYEFISSVDASQFQSSIAFNTASQYDKCRIILKDVGHNSASNLGLTLMINGFFQSGAYTGHKLLSNSISPISTNAILPTTFNSAKDITGCLDVEYTPSGYATAEGFTIGRITASDTLDVNAEFHRSMLRLKVAGITSIVIGWTPASAVFNKGTIELWGVPK